MPQLRLDRLLLETDAPYLAPHPYRGQRNEPAYVPLIAGDWHSLVHRTGSCWRRRNSRHVAESEQRVRVAVLLFTAMTRTISSCKNHDQRLHSRPGYAPTCNGSSRKMRSMGEEAYGPLAEAFLHLIGSGGKRLRPALALAAYGFFASPASERAIAMAAAVETLHTATLVHDDLIDGAMMRRGSHDAQRSLGQRRHGAGRRLPVRPRGWFCRRDRECAGRPALRRHPTHHLRGGAAPALLQPPMAPAERHLLPAHLRQDRLALRLSHPLRRHPGRRRPDRSRRSTTTAITWAWRSRSWTTSWTIAGDEPRWASRSAATCARAS